jgi:glycosyltransferase involved in cell wall biosynthesis/aminoglycoside phosphotransferase
MPSLSPERLRVVVLFDTAGFVGSLPLTGAATRTCYLNKHLVERGHDVRLLLCDLNEASQPTTTWPFATDYVPFSLLYGDGRALVRQLRPMAPDLVVVSNTQLLVRHANALRRAVGCKVIYEMHDVEADLLKSLGAPEQAQSDSQVLQRAALAEADMVVAFTDVSARAARTMTQTPVCVVPCGVEASEGMASVRDDGQHKLSVAFVGNLFYEPNKLALRFIDTHLAPSVRRAGAAVRVFGRYPWGLRTQVHSTNLHLHGPVEYLQAALRTCHIGVAPIDAGSGMNLKVLEYMAAGLPVVATPSALEGFDEPNEFAVPTSLNMFADIVATLLHDPTRRARLGNRAGHRARSTSSWARSAEIAEEVYLNTAALELGFGKNPVDVQAAQLAGDVPFWLREWQRQAPVSAARVDPNSHVVVPLGIQLTRLGAESALSRRFSQKPLLGFSGRSAVFLADDAVLKVYTHRSAERLRRETSGLAAASRVLGGLVPDVLGLDAVPGGLAWLSSQRQPGDNWNDAGGRPSATARAEQMGVVLRCLHSAPVDTLLPFDGRPVPVVGSDRDADHITAQLSRVTIRCGDAGGDVLVHGDFSLRNVLWSVSPPNRLTGLVDFEKSGRGCRYDDLATFYVHDVLLGTKGLWAPFVATYLGFPPSARQSPPEGTALSTNHLLYHALDYARWVLGWAPQLDTEFAAAIRGILPALEVEDLSVPTRRWSTWEPWFGGGAR